MQIETQHFYKEPESAETNHNRNHSKATMLRLVHETELPSNHRRHRRHRRRSSEGSELPPPHHSSSPPLSYGFEAAKRASSPSPVASPPPRSTLAARAEKETIFCLKRECKALKMAMRALPKHGKEWTVLNAKLEIAAEELQATLEDVDMARNYSAGAERRGGGGAPGVPTPPLASPRRPEFGRQFSSPDCSTGRDGFFRSSRPPSSESADDAAVDVVADVDSLEHDLQRTERFSLDYFRIKKKIDSAKRSGSSPASSLSSGEGGGSPRLLRSLESNEEEADAATATPTPPFERRTIHVANGLQNLAELLDVVPKYSLEWFNLKKDIKAASQSSSNSKERTFSFDTAGSDPQNDGAANPSGSSKKSEPRKPHRRRTSPGMENSSAQYHHVRTRLGVISIQKVWRGRVQRSRFLDRKVASICIQATFRKAAARRRYIRILSGAISIQSHWRGHVQRVRLRIVTSSGVHSHSQIAEEEDEDLLRMQKSIDAMKHEKMSMESKLLQLKNDIDTIKNDKLRQDLIRMKRDVESLEHVRPGHLFDNYTLASDTCSMTSAQANVFSVVLDKPGPLGIEMEHHKTSDSVIVAGVKRKSQADKAGLQRGDIIVGFRSVDHPEGMEYARFVALARRGTRPLVLDLTRVDPSVVGSSRRSGFFRKKRQG